MPSYRVYFLDGAGRIDLPQFIKASDDTDAMRQAEALKEDAMKREVWFGTRLVGTIDNERLTG